MNHKELLTSMGTYRKKVTETPETARDFLRRLGVLSPINVYVCRNCLNVYTDLGETCEICGSEDITVIEINPTLD